MQLHHAVLFVGDGERSLRFYRDGVGCTVLVDREFDGDWPTLLGVASTRLRAIILGNPDDPHVGQVELVTLAEPVPVARPRRRRRPARSCCRSSSRSSRCWRGSSPSAPPTCAARRSPTGRGRDRA